jgi:hypothetical protein
MGVRGSLPDYMQPGRATFTGPTAGGYVTFGFTTHDLINSEVGLFRFVAPFDMRIMYITQNCNLRGSDPTFKIENETAGTVLRAAATIGQDTAVVAYGAEESAVIANTDVSRGDVLLVTLEADAGDAAADVTVFITAWVRGHTVDSDYPAVVADGESANKKSIEGRTTIGGPLAGFYYIWAIGGSDFAFNDEAAVDIYRMVCPFDMRVMETTIVCNTKATSPTYSFINASEGNNIVAQRAWPAVDTPETLNTALTNRGLSKGDILTLTFGNGAGDAVTDFTFMATFYVKGHRAADKAND